MLARAILVLPPVLLLAGVWAPFVARPARATAAAPGPPVVLVTLDTFRADFVGAIGGGDRTPHLDALASAGAIYTRAQTTAPLTGPAHASMLTGAGSLEHQLLANGDAVRMETVIPRIRDAGWRTGAFLSSHVLDRHSGLNAGFSHFDDRWGTVQRALWIPGLRALDPPRRTPRRVGDQTIARALDWLATADGRALVWIHLYDAHAPYRPPPDRAPNATALQTARDADHAAFTGGGTLLERLDSVPLNQQKLWYEASIRWTDALVGRLVAALPPEAVVIVVGDHGESLDEHGYLFNHGARLWEESTHVPLVVRWPGRLAPGTRSDVLVSVTQVSRLLLQATGVEPWSRMEPVTEVAAYTTGQQARGLLALGLRGERTRQGASIRRERTKVLSHDGGPPVYYDLSADPDEEAPLPVPPERADDAREVERMVAVPTRGMNADQRERLRELGYLE